MVHRFSLDTQTWPVEVERTRIEHWQNARGSLLPFVSFPVENGRLAMRGHIYGENMRTGEYELLAVPMAQAPLYWQVEDRCVTCDRDGGDGKDIIIGEWEEHDGCSWPIAVGLLLGLTMLVWVLKKLL